MSRFDNNCLWITGHVHDGVVAAVLVGVFGDEGEAAHLGVADPVQGGLSHDAAEFDLVQKFHCKQVYRGWTWALGPGALPVAGRDKGRGEAVGRPRKRSFGMHLFMILARIACFLPGRGRKKRTVRIKLAARVSRCFKKKVNSALFFLPSLE